MMTRILLLAVPALLLLALSPTGAAADPYGCYGLTPGESVCLTRTWEEGTCATATQFGQATDFGTIQKVCFRETWGGGCASGLAGLGTYTGFYGAAGAACVHLARDPPADACAGIGLGPWDEVLLERSSWCLP